MCFRERYVSRYVYNVRIQYFKYFDLCWLL